jgi:hypothetical protein
MRNPISDNPIVAPLTRVSPIKMQDAFMGRGYGAQQYLTTDGPYVAVLR